MEDAIDGKLIQFMTGNRLKHKPTPTSNGRGTKAAAWACVNLSIVATSLCQINDPKRRAEN
jgi:hypothetical protein